MKTKKVATNIPVQLLLEAVKLTGLNQTQAIIAGLEELVAREKRKALLNLKGNVKISLDVDKIRGRKKVS